MKFFQFPIWQAMILTVVLCLIADQYRRLFVDKPPRPQPRLVQK